MKPWLTIIGMGEDGEPGLSASAKNALTSAEVIIGSKRLLAMLGPYTAELKEWPQPFAAVVDQIRPLRGRSTVVLATGDPLNFGAGRKLLEIVPPSETRIFPGLSSFSLAAARMGWSLPDCDCFTIHGRPAANLELFIQPDARLLVLTEDATSIAEACRRLAARGFEASKVTVLENMGGTRERVTHFTASSAPAMEFSALNTLAIHCIAGPHANRQSRVPGLPDDAFQHDGQITKREVRAATLAALAPAPDYVLWDVGAGSGSISIEWMRSTRGCQAFAVEADSGRRAMMAANADALGTPRLKIISGAAPVALKGLPPPHAIFIGGGLNDAGVFETCWYALRTGGNLVANTVTLEGDRHLITLQEKYGGDLVRMDVSTLTNVGNLRALRPRMSVLQWRAVKP